MGSVDYIMVIEEYLEVGMPIADILLQYGESIATGLAGAGLIALLKK